MKNKILNVILIGYIIVLIWLLLVPNVFRGEQTWYSNVFSYQHFVDSNLIPFRTIIMYIYCLKNGNINIDIPIKNVLANFFMFMPIKICITKISTFLILCDLAVCLATLYVSFSLVFALMRYLQGKVFLIRFYSPTTLSSSRAEFRLPSRLACA